MSPGGGLAENSSAPALIVVRLVNDWFPDSISVPAPFFVSVPEPLMAAELAKANGLAKTSVSLLVMPPPRLPS
jgi:hypothetical protein